MIVGSVQWPLKRFAIGPRQIMLGLGVFGLLATGLQPWEQGGQLLSNLFGTTTNEDGLELVRGYSSPQGLFALLLAA